jgi:glycosyltransferase involved in cell wall biosynthesis
MEMDEKNPKVSVCVVTYNQEKYIHQCLQSIVDQETDFDFEVIVSDDCSTDGTRAIVQGFAEKYPRVVKAIFHEKNIGAVKNFIHVHSLAKGEYVAHMDGDDSWRQGKLSFQVSYLDSDPSCRYIADYIGIRKLQESQILKFDENKLFAENNPVLHSSKLYRRSIHENMDHSRESYLDFESNLRHLASAGICALTAKKTTNHTITSSSIRSRINSSVIDGYMCTLNYAKEISINQNEIASKFDEFIKGQISLAIITLDLTGGKIIQELVKTSNLTLRYSTRLRLILASQFMLMIMARFGLLFKRRISAWRLLSSPRVN